MKTATPFRRALLVTIALGVGTLAVVSANPAGAAPQQAGKTTTTAASTSSSTSSSNTTTVRADPAGDVELAKWALVLTGLLGTILLIVVAVDRWRARDGELEALKLGSTDVSVVQVPIVQDQAAAGGGPPPPPGTPPAEIVVTPASAVLVVGTSLELVAAQGGAPASVTWTFEPPDALSTPAPATGASIKVTAAKTGSVDIKVNGTIKAKAQVLPAPTRGKISFSALGQGLATGLVAIVAIGGAVALAFRGDFTGQIATLLGVAVGAGVTGTVAAARGTSAPTTDPTKNNAN